MRLAPALSTAACLLALAACGSDDGDTQAPSVPAGVTVYASSSTSAHVMWNHAADNGAMERYEVYRDGVKVKDVPAARHMVDVTGLKPSASYKFTVRARDTAGNVSGASSAVRVTTPSSASDDEKAPTRPAGLKGRVDGPRSATLTWKKSEDNHKVTSYDIYQAGTKIHSVDGGVTTASITTLRPGTRYTFTVKARDAADNVSPASPAVKLTTEAEPEGGARAEAPTDLQVTARSADGRYHLDLVWNAPKAGGEITEYEVYLDGEFGSTLVLGPSAPKDTGTISLPVDSKRGVTHAVKVRAKLPDGNWGAFSPEVKVTTGGAKP